jgi:pimeloyl-ACP methyl ester carboxylesterase
MAYYQVGRPFGLPMVGRWILLTPVAEGAFWVAAWRYRLDLWSTDALPGVARSRIPLLVIDDDRDDVVPRRDAQRVHDANPRRVTMWMVPGASHTGASTTAPDAYRRHVLDFLAQHQ